MAQTETGIRSILSFSFFYNLLGKVIGADSFYSYYIKKYLSDLDGLKILDIGCGTANILSHFPRNVDYVGFDLNPRYIDLAREKFSEQYPNATFICSPVKDFSEQLNGDYDIVMANALLHHLDDDEALKVFEIAQSALKEGGKLITVDNVYVEGQSFLAKKIISFDRGLNIRNPEGYLAIARKLFKSVEYKIEHNLLRIPYTHIIMSCSGSGARSTASSSLKA